MRVRSLLLAAFWVAVFIWVGYNGMQAVSSYFQTNDVAEQAFRDASDKQRVRNPEFIIAHAVKGMLPKNRIAAKMLTKLRVFAGPAHTHESNSPQKISV